MLAPRNKNNSGHMTITFLPLGRQGTRWYSSSFTVGVIFEKYETLLTALEEVKKGEAVTVG